MKAPKIDSSLQSEKGKNLTANPLLNHEQQESITHEKSTQKTSSAMVSSQAKSFVLFVIVGLVCLFLGYGLAYFQYIDQENVQTQLDNKVVHPQKKETLTDLSKVELEQEQWTCSMHPQVQAKNSGRCPLCGMDLIQSMTEDTTLDKEYPELKLSSRARHLAQLQTSPVELKLLKETTAPFWGEVSIADKYRSTISAWIAGRVERLYVSQTGQEVKRGQALAELYSPEIYNAHQSLLTALKSKGHRSILKATRERLRLLGVSKTQLKQMEKAQKPWKRLIIRSTVTGSVLNTNIQLGSYVNVGQVLFKLVNLDHLQVQLHLNEQELSNVLVGQQFVIETKALPHIYFKATVKIIEPTLDSVSRFAIAQLDVENKSYLWNETNKLDQQKKKNRKQVRLLPGMVITAKKYQDQKQMQLQLVIPESAPLFAGDHSLVYMAHKSSTSEETYQARVVKLGKKVGAYYPVLSGLSRGETIVSRGAFTLDSESQIRGLFSLSTLAKRGHENLHLPLKKTQLTIRQEKQFASHVASYIHLQKSLAADRFEEAKKQAKNWLTQVKKGISKEELKSGLFSTNIEEWQELNQLLKYDLNTFVEQEDIAGQRLNFKYITAHLLHLVQLFGNPTKTSLYHAYCPMAFEDQGASWLQGSETIDNAYFGAQMRRCGIIKQKLSPKSLLPQQHESGLR